MRRRPFAVFSFLNAILNAILHDVLSFLNGRTHTGETVHSVPTKC